MGRLLEEWFRLYVDGIDFSGDMRQAGELRHEFSAKPDASWTDQVKNVLPGQCTIGVGPLNGFFNAEPAGLHTLATDAQVKRTVLLALGDGAEPAMGVPAFCGEFRQTGYQSKADNGYIVATLPLADADGKSIALAYATPWGVLLHPKGSATAANTATGVDDAGGQTAFGGYLVYQVFSSDGTFTLSVEDAATNLDASFAALSGASSGELDASLAPQFGCVALERDATVRQYLRWQLALNSAATVNFALAFVRARF